jgi:hypothetical protein
LINPTPLDGFAKKKIFVSSNSVILPTTSSLSKNMYCVTFIPLMFVMLFYENHICGSVMLSFGPWLLVMEEREDQERKG